MTTEKKARKPKHVSGLAERIKAVKAVHDACILNSRLYDSDIFATYGVSALITKLKKAGVIVDTSSKGRYAWVTKLSYNAIVDDVYKTKRGREKEARIQELAGTKQALVDVSEEMMKDALREQGFDVELAQKFFEATNFIERYGVTNTVQFLRDVIGDKIKVILYEH